MSARAQRIKKLHGALAIQGEDDGIDTIARHLYLHPEMWDGDDSYVHNIRNRDLVRGFMPPAPDSTARQLGKLENPRPGTLNLSLQA